MNSSRPASQSSTPGPSASPQVRSTATPPQAADPFASLVSASPRPGAGGFQPPAPQSQGAPATSSLLDLAGGPTAPPQPAGQVAAEDDEWNFASSLPQSNALPATNQVQVLNSQLRVEFQARRHQAAPRQIYVKAVFSNTTSQAISELHFQVAVEKVSSQFMLRLGYTVFEFRSLTSFRHIPCRCGRRPAGTLRRNSSTGCSRRWYWTASTRAKVTLSKFGSRCPTSWEPRLARNKAWYRLWGSSRDVKAPKTLGNPVSPAKAGVAWCEANWILARI